MCVGNPQQLPASTRSRVSCCSQASFLSSSQQLHSKHSSSPPVSLRDIADVIQSWHITLKGASWDSAWPPAPRSPGAQARGAHAGTCPGPLACRSMSRATHQYHRQQPEEGGRGEVPARWWPYLVPPTWGGARSALQDLTHLHHQAGSPRLLPGNSSNRTSGKFHSRSTGKHLLGLGQVHLPRGAATEA